MTLLNNDILSSSKDLTLKRWSYEDAYHSWKESESVETDSAIKALITLPTGEVVSSSDQALSLWKDNTAVKLVSAEGVRGLAVKPGDGFVSASDDGCISFWDRRLKSLGKMIGSQCHTSSALSVDCSGSLIVSGGKDCYANIWSDEVCVKRLEHPGWVWDAKFMTSGEIITACADGVARVWTLDPDLVAEGSAVKYNAFLQRFRADRDITQSNLQTFFHEEGFPPDNLLRIFRISKGRWLNADEILDIFKSCDHLPLMSDILCGPKDFRTGLYLTKRNPYKDKYKWDPVSMFPKTYSKRGTLVGSKGTVRYSESSILQRDTGYSFCKRVHRHASDKKALIHYLFWDQRKNLKKAINLLGDEEDSEDEIAVEAVSNMSLIDRVAAYISEVGDWKTTALLAAEFVKEAKPFIEGGADIVSIYHTACSWATKKVQGLAFSLNGLGLSVEEKKSLLAKVAATSLSSELTGVEKKFFATMVVDACMGTGNDDGPGNDDGRNLIGIKRIPGGSRLGSFFVKGVIFKKTSPGLEQQPKKVTNPKILLLNMELESEKESHENRLSDAELILKLEKCVDSGANVILSRLAIGCLATQYFADRDIFCAGSVAEEDLELVATAAGGIVQTSVNNITTEAVGTCNIFEEKDIGGERFNIFSGWTFLSTIVLRGETDDLIAKSVHDSLLAVRRCLEPSDFFPGGGAIEMEIRKYLMQQSLRSAANYPVPSDSDSDSDSNLIKSEVIRAYAKAFEVIPRHLCVSAGYDPVDLMDKLRNAHRNDGGAYYGVDSGGVDSVANCSWELLPAKISQIASATEAACQFLTATALASP